MLPPKLTKFTVAALIFGLLAGSSLVAQAAEAGPQKLRAEQKADRVIIYVADQIFTEYLFLASEKYPYFFPVNGPRSGKTVTTRREKDYPHHSSIFFGCDRVNGGNYWQEGLERGRIAHQSLRLVKAAGAQIVFEEECRWERPNAEAPFDDHRKIVIAAPTPAVRYVDFEVKLTARIKVRIEKTNHSLFSGRVAPELSVKGGGAMINAQGDQAEKGTFGKKSAWMDYRGKRGGLVEGIAIFDHPKNRWAPTPWFTRDYGFFSPTPMNWLENNFLEIPAGESIQLRYRVMIHANDPTKDQVEAEYQQWLRE
jgi:hypothetical protein